DRADTPARAARAAADRQPVVLDPTILAAAQQDAVFAGHPWRPALEASPQRASIRLPVIRVDQAEPVLGAEASAVEPENLHQPGRDEQRVLFDIPVVNAFGDRLADER